MIVCVCNNISEGRIRQAVNAGLSTMSELRKELGVATCCGKCHSCAKHVLRESLNDAAQTRQPAYAMAFHANAALA